MSKLNINIGTEGNDNTEIVLEKRLEKPMKTLLNYMLYLVSADKLALQV